MTTNSARGNHHNKQLLAIGVLAILGSIDALYLTWVKVAGTKTACAGVGDCETVNTSIYSEIAGVPIAALGLAMYVLIGFLVWIGTRQPELTEWLQLAVFGLSLAGMVVSGWLTYVEIEVLQAICPYCVISTILISAIFALSTIGIMRRGHKPTD